MPTMGKRALNNYKKKGAPVDTDALLFFYNYRLFSWNGSQMQSIHPDIFALPEMVLQFVE